MKKTHARAPHMFAISGKPTALPARAAAGDCCELNRMRCTQLPVQRSKH
ncbi:MAG: hypothetical protein Q7U75_04110 [Desulfobacterales bacterium]|nr:hypothetical protein [Desulfobacterales bacterium]